MESRLVDNEAALVDDLLQTANDEHEEMDRLKQEIRVDIIRLILTPLELISMMGVVKLEKDLDRYNELKRKYRG